MKFGIFTCMTTEWGPEEAIEKIAKHGWDGIEWAVKMDDDPKGYSLKWSRALADSAAIAEKTRKAGLEIPEVNFSGLNPDTKPDRVKQALDVALSMGAKQARFGMLSYAWSAAQAEKSNYTKLYKKAVKKLGEAVKIASKQKLKLMIECHHGTITCSAALALRVAENFSPKQVGVILDPGNQVIEGFENWKMEMELLGKYLAHVHLKSARRDIMPSVGGAFPGIRADWRHIWAPVTVGLVDWLFVFKSLRTVGYDAWIGMEDFSDQPTENKLKQIGMLREWAAG